MDSHQVESIDVGDRVAYDVLARSRRAQIAPPELRPSMVAVRDAEDAEDPDALDAALIDVAVAAIDTLIRLRLQRLRHEEPSP